MNKLLLTLMLLLACFVLYAQDNPGDIWVNPAIRYLLPGQEFDLEMYMNTGDTLVSAFHLDIAYDVQYLQTDLSETGSFNDFTIFGRPYK